MLNRGHRYKRKRIGDFTSKITSLTRPTTTSKSKEKMTLRMHSLLAVALIHLKTTLTCRRFMNKSISCPTQKSRLRERRRLRIVFSKKSTIKTTLTSNPCFRFSTALSRVKEDSLSISPSISWRIKFLTEEGNLIKRQTKPPLLRFRPRRWSSGDLLSTKGTSTW